MTTATTNEANGTAFSQKTPAAVLLAELIGSAKNLPSTASDLGTVLLGIKEIQKRINVLNKGSGDENDTKAHYLLAGSGVNGEDIASELVSLTSQISTLEPGTFYSIDGDLENYLRAKREESILSSIDAAVRATSKEFDNFLAQNVSLDWKVQKQLICEHFGLVSSSSGKPEVAGAKLIRSIGPRTWGKSSLGRMILGPLIGDSTLFSDVDLQSSGGDAVSDAGTPTTAQPAELSMGPYILIANSRPRKYADAIMFFNQQRQEKNLIPISHLLAQATYLTWPDGQSQQLYDSWNILARVTGETNEKPIKERFFAPVYLDSAKNSKGLVKLRRQIVKGSLTYLQKQFFGLVESEIAKRPQEAKLGGVPSVVNKVKAFLNLKYLKAGQWINKSLEIAEDAPMWAVMFYLLRSGHVKEAITYAQSREPFFQKVERAFPSYLKEYYNVPVQQLSRETLERVTSEFSQHIRYQLDGDPYKFALYKLLSRAELGKKNIPRVVHTAEDWLWIHLMLTREPEADAEPDPYHETYSLSDLQRTIIQYGAKHFNPNRTNPGLYFQILLLAGLFEYAIHYLYSFTPMDAVHFAIALTYYGLLRPVEDPTTRDNELLVLGEDERARINFPRLVGYYTRDFRRADPTEAVDYLVLIALNGDLPNGQGEKHLLLCHEALKELVLETREFSQLLGDILADGTRQVGAIEKRTKLIRIKDEEDYLQTITSQAAAKADADGRTADAVLLYQLSHEYDTVVYIVNKSLGEALGLVDISSPVSRLPPGASLMISATEDPAQLARNMMQVYSANPEILSQVSPKHRETCLTLLRIVDARDEFVKQNWEVCLDMVQQTGILSLSPTENIGTVRRKAQQFVGLDESIARNVPTLVLMVMQCCVNIGQEVNSSSFSNSTRMEKLINLRTIARNCMIYAGMIQYRMPRDIYSQLTNLELMI